MHSYCVHFYLLCFFAPFFNDSFTVPQCAAAAGGPEHVFYYHFCGSFTVCAKVCVRVRTSVCVYVCVKGHKKFWAFCSSILISIYFALRWVEFLPPPHLLLLLVNFFRIFLLFAICLYFWHLTKSRKPDPVESIKWACWQHATVSLSWSHTNSLSQYVEETGKGEGVTGWCFSAPIATTARKLFKLNANCNMQKKT